ncbi:MAG: SEC-C metal-binding domain-containing protein, partial [Bradymonadaceae bacterium]
MSNPVSLSEVPESIGRNDPCPCGSNRKYKQCCFRIHQVEREASKQNRSPDQLIGSTTIPWKVFKIFRQ